MPYSTKYHCPTPKCVAVIEKYGEKYHRVYDKDTSKFIDKGYIAKCGGCGGLMREDGTWEHTCKSCGKEVEPGKLCGLFVPHKCGECEQKLADQQIKEHRVCGMCRQPYSRCCC